MTSPRRSGQATPTIHLVGLGPGSAELLTLRSWELLASGLPMRIRDPGFEAAQTVLARGLEFEAVEERDPEAIAGSVVAWAREVGACVYAMPGHPLQAPETVPIFSRALPHGVVVSLEPGLTELDRELAEDPETGTFAGPAAMRGAIAFGRLVAVMARLRAPGGCPWDAEQTHRSLAIHLLEETHEVLDAIDRNDLLDLEEELGDLLLQVVFHSELAAEQERFEVGDVVEELAAKLVYRHPHVFGDVTVSGAGEVVKNWEALKHEQKRRTSLGEGIPKDLPGLLYAHKVQRRLSGAGVAPETGEPEVLAALGAEVEAALAHNRRRRGDGGGGAGVPAGRVPAGLVPAGRVSSGGVPAVGALEGGVPAVGRPDDVTDLVVGDQDEAAELAVGELLYAAVALAQRAGVDPEGALRRTAQRHLGEAELAMPRAVGPGPGRSPSPR
ncbi:MAG: MazG family protein [Actinomycetota bacterium]